MHRSLLLRRREVFPSRENETCSQNAEGSELLSCSNPTFPVRPLLFSEAEATRPDGGEPRSASSRRELASGTKHKLGNVRYGDNNPPAWSHAPAGPIFFFHRKFPTDVLCPFGYELHAGTEPV